MNEENNLNEINNSVNSLNESDNQLNVNQENNNQLNNNISNQKNNKNTSKVILIVILTILLIASLSFIVYDKFIKKDEVNNQQNTEENSNQGNKDEITLKQINIDSDVVRGLVYPVNNRYSPFGAYPKWEYKNITIDEFSRLDMIRNAFEYTEMQPVSKNDDIWYYSALEIENNFKKIFGPDTKYTNGDAIGDDTGDSFKYNKENNTYGKEVGIGGDSLGHSAYKTKLYKAEQDNENIYTYFYVQPYTIQVSCKTTDCGKSEIYTYLCNRESHEDLDTNCTEKFVGEIDIDSKIDNLMNNGKVDTYKFTFKKQSDGKYYFYSGEWV